MTKRFIISVCCLVAMMLSITAQEACAEDWSLWISSEEGIGNEQMAAGTEELTDQNCKHFNTYHHAFSKPKSWAEESIITPILLTEELNHQANLYYKMCGFNFEKECCCGCNAPPRSEFITIYPKGSYTMSKTAEKDALSRFAIPLLPHANGLKEISIITVISHS